MSQKAKKAHLFLLFFIILSINTIMGQGNLLSIQVSAPKRLSVCGIQDTVAISVFNISSGSVNGIKITLNLPPGVFYVPNTTVGGGVTQNNISNLNKPVFSANNLSIAKNFRFRVTISSNCDILNFLNNNNTPIVAARVDYTGNYDVGNSIPFSVNVPSVQFNSITNSSFTGDIGSKFGRKISMSNFGKGPLEKITLIRINGKDIKTFKCNIGTTAFKNDTVITTLGAKDFKLIGNFDTLLDQNEIIEIIDSSEIIGCKSLVTNYELYWGCNNKKCISVKNSGIALISNKIPQLKIIATAGNTTCFQNNTITHSLRVTNIGTMNANVPKVVITQYYFNEFSKLDTSTVKFKINHNGTFAKALIDSTYGNNSSGQYACLGANPIGAFRVKLPNIKPKDTIYIIWDSKSCLPSNSCNLSFYLNSWGHLAEYYDQCNNKLSLPFTWAKTYDYNAFPYSAYTPTDLVDQQKKEFRYSLGGATLLPRASDALYYIELIVPPGLKHSKNKNEFYFTDANLTAQWQPDTILIKGDTIRGIFPHPVPISLTNAELIFFLFADCSVSGSNGSKTIKVNARYSPSGKCGQREWIYLMCSSISLKVHCGSNCKGGMLFTNFNVERSNFGLPDNDNNGLPDNNGTLDMVKIRKERAIYGDTILAEYHGRAIRTNTIFTWRFGYIESTVTYGKFLDIVGAKIEIHRRSNNTVTICNALKYTKTTTGNNATFKIDFSVDSLTGCVPNSFAYRPFDSIVVKVQYRLSQNIGGASYTSVFNNRFYFSDVRNPISNNNKFQCDTFSGQQILTGFYFTRSNAITYQSNSCNQIKTYQYFYLGIGACCSNYGGKNYFSHEYRNFAKIKGLNFYTPAGFRVINTTITQIRTAGSNKTATEASAPFQPKKQGSNPLFFESSGFYKDSSGNINLSDDGFHGYFTTTIEPTCAIATNNNIPLEYELIFERKGTFGKGFDTISSAGADGIIQYSQPVISVNPVSPTIYAASDTAEWEIVYTNSSPTFATLNTWFSPDNSGLIKVVEIKEATKDTALKQNNLIFRAGAIPQSSVRKYKVRAVYNTCQRDSILLYIGWNCSGYPTDLPSYSCKTEKLVLFIEPQNTQFQITLTDSTPETALCQSVPYRMLVENIGPTTSYNTKAIITLPVGMEIIKGSCSLKYPFKSPSTSIAEPNLVSGTTYEWNLSLLSSFSNGFKGTSDTNRNKFEIYFRVKTNCDYSSGNYLRASASANIKCGNPVTVYPSISNPLNIKGVTRPYYTLLKVNADTVFPCEKASKVRVKIINLGPDNTGIDDKYQIILLPGMVYDSSLYSATYNAPANYLTKTRNINGATEVEFSLPKNIAPGDSIQFELGYYSDGNYLSCGTTDLYSQAAVKQEVMCISDSSKCKINVVTGNTLTRPNVVKGALIASNLSSRIVTINQDNEAINLSYTLKNNSFKISKFSKTILHYYYDKNNSGTVDAGDTKLSSDSLNIELSKNETLSLNKNLTVEAGYSCAILMTFDSLSCMCSFPSYKFPVPELKNAGRDTAFCDGNFVQIGTPLVKNFKYLWHPDTDVSSDTISQPYFTFRSNNNTPEKREQILTTYRGHCISKDTLLVTVYPLPQINMIQKDTLVCMDEPVFTKCTINGGTGEYKTIWKSGLQVSDSNALQTLAHTDTSRKFLLFVTDSFGCKDVDSFQITVKPFPKAWFGFDENLCEGYAVQIFDSSYINTDSISNYHWEYGNYDTIQVKKLEIITTSDNPIKVKLEVKSPFGCTDSVSRVISVHPIPDVNFTTNNICLGDSSFLLDSSFVSVGFIKDYEWETSDNAKLIGKQPAHLFQSSGVKNIKLKVTTNYECVDSLIKQVVVYENPVADFSFNNVCYGDTSFFQNNSYVLNDSISYYEWKYPNNHNAKTKNSSYFFNTDGFFPVKQIVTTSNGCSDSITKNVFVYPLPVCNFTVAPACEKDSNSFQDNSSVKSTNINQWIWTLGDGNSNTNKNFKHLYATSDNYNVNLKIITDKGCSDSTNKSVWVYPKLVPDFTLNDICIGDTLKLTDQSAGTNALAVKWRWHFTQNDSAFAQNPSFLYKTPGSYDVNLQVFTQHNCAYDTTKKFTIHPIPTIDFSDTNKCFDNYFIFNSEISLPFDNIQSIFWNFGDGNTSSEKSPKHYFSKAGNYKVQLKAVTDFGCFDSTYKLITSYPPVTVDFVSENVCFGEVVNFQNKSVVKNASITEYKWQFGDGEKESVMNPKYYYDAPGTYAVNLTIKTSYQCYYDTTKSVTIYPVPIAGYLTDPPGGYIVSPVISFNDQSIGADSVWYVTGDGKIYKKRNFTHSYKDSGTYTTQQFVTNNFGCSDSASETVTIQYLYTFYTPNAFSPNGNNKNDLFGPKGLGIANYEMQIFSKWGELIYTTTESKPWDGTHNGMPVSEGVYLVVYKVTDFKGGIHYLKTSVTLLR